MNFTSANPRSFCFSTGIALVSIMLPLRPVVAVEPMAVQSSEETQRAKAEADVKLYGRRWAQFIAGGKENTTEARRVQQKYEAALRALGYDAKAHKYELLWPQRQRLIGQLTHEVIIGRRNERSGRNLSQRINTLSQLMGDDASDDLAHAFEAGMYRLAREWVIEKTKENPNQQRLKLLERQIQRLGPGSRHEPNALLRNVVADTLGDRLRELAIELTELIAAGEENSARSREVRRLVTHLQTQLGPDTQEPFPQRLKGHLEASLRSYAVSVTYLKNSYQPDAKELAAAHQKVQRLASVLKVSPEQALANAEPAWFSGSSRHYAHQLVEEKAKDQPDIAKIDFLHKKLEEVVRKNLAKAIKHNPLTYYREMEELLSNAEISHWRYIIEDALTSLATEKSLTKPDQENVARLENQIEKTIKSLTPPAQEYFNQDQFKRFGSHNIIYRLRRLLIAEYAKENPDNERLSQLEESFARRQHHDWYIQSRNAGSGTRLGPIADPEQFGRWRAERMKVRAQGEKIEKTLKTQQDQLPANELRALQEQRAKLAERENELRVRMGDPLLSVEAPPDAHQVIALMPGGEVKKLLFNIDSKKWEARFDVPTYASEGEYSITIIVVAQDGTRETLTIRYHVDLTAPKGKGKVAVATSEGAGSTPVLQLTLDGTDDTKRVVAVMASGERIILNQNVQDKKSFTAFVPMPALQANSTSSVTFIVTDEAHNRTEVTVDMTK